MPKMGMLRRINDVLHCNPSTRMVLMYLDGGIAYVTLRMILWFCRRHMPLFAHSPHSSIRMMTSMSFGAMLNRVHPAQVSHCGEKELMLSCGASCFRKRSMQKVSQGGAVGFSPDLCGRW